MRGGARPGAGRPKGSKDKPKESTAFSLKAREFAEFYRGMLDRARKGIKLLHNGFFGKVEIIGNVYEMELVVEQDGARGINPIQHAREAVGLAGGNKMLRRYIGNVLKQKED